MNKLTRWMILVIVSSALFLIVIDMTVLYTALPMLTHDLAATASEKLWIVNAYPLVVAGLLPGLGTLGDRFGHKRMFISGLTVFGIASYIAAYAATPSILIGGRILLAVGAALMMPATLSIIRITFTDENERSVAFGIWSSIAAAGAGLGPVVGGLLLNYFWWGSVFLINIPIAIIALIMGVIIIPNIPGNKDREWDFVGSMLVMIGLAGIIFAIQEISRNGGSYFLVAVAAFIGILSLVIFIIRQRTHSVALIDFTLFRNRRFSSGVLTAFISFLTLAGVELAISQRLQLVLGYTPLKAGTIIIAIALASFVSGTTIGFFLPRFNILRVQWVSLLIASIGLFGFLILFNSTLVVQICFLVIIGVGVGIAMTVASYAVMTNAPSEKAGMAASIEEVAFELGGAVGIAVLGGLLTAMYTVFMTIPSGLNVHEKVMSSLDEALLVAENLATGDAAMLIEAGKIAFDKSFVIALTTGTAILLFGAIIIALMARREKSSY